jgi:hypothetical protein
LKCSEEEDWLSLSNGTIYIDTGIKKKHGGISCNITLFDRIDDFGNKDLKELYFSNEKGSNFGWTHTCLYSSELSSLLSSLFSNGMLGLSCFDIESPI